MPGRRGPPCVDRGHLAGLSTCSFSDASERKGSQLRIGGQRRHGETGKTLLKRRTEGHERPRQATPLPLTDRAVMHASRGLQSGSQVCPRICACARATASGSAREREPHEPEPDGQRSQDEAPRGGRTRPFRLELRRSRSTGSTGWRTDRRCGEHAPAQADDQVLGLRTPRTPAGPRFRTREPATGRAETARYLYSTCSPPASLEIAFSRSSCSPTAIVWILMWRVAFHFATSARIVAGSVCSPYVGWPSERM